MRAAVYSGTSNIYEQMLTSAKSLLEHSNVEKIYFLIENDEFPYELPSEIECRNISNQQYFKKDGPNFQNILSYMVLIRVAYTKIFPELDRILSIDMDTIVNENISELWDLDLTGYYLAAAEELEVTKREGSYINMGVAMLNLKKIREEHKDDELIYNLNTFWYRWNEQDAINQLFRGDILILPADYNACWQTGLPQHEKITHFAGIYDLEHFPNFDYYKKLPINQLKRNLPDKITLDIIIPTYKNKEGLRHSLNSIKMTDDVNVIVVDDCSNLDYTDIINEYSFIHFYQLETNQGPGMARQYGIEHSNGTYILFLDTGDYLSEDGIETILNQIKENTYIKMYSWQYIDEETNTIQEEFDSKMIGKVFKRSFIEMYHICFSKEGSYIDEDYGFIHACELIFIILQSRKFISPRQHNEVPLFFEEYNPNSVTKKNNGEYTYIKFIPGAAINCLHAINIAKKYNLSDFGIINDLCFLMAFEYYYFLRIAQEKPEYLQYAWNAIRKFYFDGYRVYSKFTEHGLQEQFIKIARPRIIKQSKEANWKKRIPINILRFVHELETEENVPNKYLT